MHQNFKHLF